MSNYREIYEEIGKPRTIRQLKDQLDRAQDYLDLEIEQLQNRCQHQWQDEGEMQIRCIHCDLVDYDQ